MIATGNEAAAHGEAITTMVLIPSLKDVLKIPVIAAGGIADGRGLAAALALGADGVAMGTRLMTTQESPLHAVYKKLSVDKDVTDTIYSRRFDGIWCRVMKTEAAERAIKRGLSIPAAISNSQEITKLLKLPFFKVMAGVMASGYKSAIQMAYLANAFKAIRVATEDGDTREGVLPVGQVQGLIRDVPTVKEVIERTVAEARQIQQGLGQQLA